MNDAPNATLTRATEIITTLGLCHYARTPDEDLSLLHWWMDMHEQGDLATMLPVYTQPLGAFMAMFRKDTLLVYTAPPVWFAFWFEPCFNGRAAWVSNWCHPDKRGTRDQLSATWALYTYLLAVYPVLFSMTKQQRVIDELAKLGYTVDGKYPKLFDDTNDAWIASLTAERFLASKLNATFERSHQWVQAAEKAAEPAAATL